MADVSATRATGRDNLMKMLLSSGSTMPVSSNIASMMPGSPSGEHSDDNTNRLSAYLHRLAGLSETEIDAVVKDHSYAKPWNWKPDNIYVKPVKKLFFNKTPKTIGEKINSEREINVEDIDCDDRTLPYDLTRARHQMDEFQRLANFVRPDDSEDDWEEKIDKILWLPIHHRTFSRVSRILSSERLARLAKSNSTGEPIFRRTSVDTAARRFRETLASTGWDLKMTQWLHSLLFEHLPRDYLAIYLDILQTLRLKIPQLIDRMIAIQPNINAKVGAISWETLSSLLKRSWDPFASCLNSNRPKKLPGNPILIIAPSNISTNVSSRQHKWISQLGTLGTVVNVHMHLGMAASRMTLMVCMDQLVQATRAKIQDVRVDCPGRPIILVGFNSGAALACQVAQMEHVTTVICLGFPFTTVEGKRGTPDDTLMDMRCPVMFVIGEKASLVRPDDLENVREKMLVETSLVVVGTADDHLRVSTSKKISEGITQSMVDRCILDEIGDFVASILLQPHPLPPRPFTLTSSSYGVKEKAVKKETRKRKNSAGGSVDGEANVSPVKKSRPGTPVSTASNMSPMTVASRIVPLAAQSALSTAPAIGCNPNVQLSNNSQIPVQKRKSRVTNTSQKHHYSDHIVSSKHMSQHASSTSNGGITLNIGSLASLAPIGPIRLAPTTASQNALTAAKGGINCRSPVTLAPKVPKIMQTNVMQQTKIKTVLPTNSTSNWNKGFSKVTAGTSMNVNLTDKGTEMKSFNVLNTSGNQIAAGASSLASQNKSIATPTTSGALTALLQSGKSVLGSAASSIITGRGIPSSSSSILLTPCINNSSASPGTITTSASAKVTDSISEATDVERMKMTNTTVQSCCRKNNLLDVSSTTEFGSIVVNPTENNHVNRVTTNSQMLLPFTNKTPTTILPLSGRFKTGQRYGNAVPKITMNSNNLHKSQRGGKLQSHQSIRKKNIINDVDEDLGNILDIPIIFAKDGDNLNMLEREHAPLGQINRSINRVEPVEIKPKRLSSTTKVVLISNKQHSDKTKIPNQAGFTNVRSSISSDLGQRNVAQVILHSRSENPSISLGGNWNSGCTQQISSRANQPTIKYTKIILAKRNSGLSVTGNNCEKSQQIIVTKSATKLNVAKTFAKNTNDGKTTHAPKIPIKISSSNVQEQNYCDDNLEIEDAIKTNIIERKLTLDIPEIDLTSPIKNQRENELFLVANATEDSGQEGHDSTQTKLDT